MKSRLLAALCSALGMSNDERSTAETDVVDCHSVDCHTAEDNFPTPQHRRELRRDTLRLARAFPPGDERNQLRSIARTLAFFEAGPSISPLDAECAPVRPRVAHPELLQRRNPPPPE